MKRIKIKLQEATSVVIIICIESVPNTLSRVREGHLTHALVVNTSGAPITLKHGLHLGQCFVYDKQEISEPEEFPDAYVSPVGSQKKGSPKQTVLSRLIY